MLSNVLNKIFILSGSRTYTSLTLFLKAFHFIIIFFLVFVNCGIQIFTVNGSRKFFFCLFRDTNDQTGFCIYEKIIIVRLKLYRNFITKLGNTIIKSRVSWGEYLRPFIFVQHQNHSLTTFKPLIGRHRFELYNATHWASA